MKSNPYQRRNIVNISLITESIMVTNQLLLKLSKKENLTGEELDELSKKVKEVSNLVQSRTFKNSVDMDYMQKGVRET